MHGSGLNPGNLSGVLPLALSGMSRTIDKITLQERADWSVYESTGITFDNMAFGQPVDMISPTATEFLAFNSSIFEEQVWFVRRLTRLDEVTATSKPSQRNRITRSSTTCCGRHTAGSVELEGCGRRRYEIETCGRGSEYPGTGRTQHGWTLTIEGDPSMRAHFYSLASFTRAASVEEHVRSASVATAMQVLNGVPAICEASTGFVTTASLPLIYNQRAFRQP